MRYTRRGSGKPLLLVHGLGSDRNSWETIAGPLVAEREVIAIDLPGFGETPPLVGEVSIATLADAVTAFLRELDLLGIDAVGSSMGARLVLELARRGVLGNVVSLDPGGFWRGWERTFFSLSIEFSIALIRAIQPIAPFLTGNPLTRSLLFAQFSAHPWSLTQRTTLHELRSFAAARSFDPLLKSLTNGPEQIGTASTPGRIVIGWGRQDRVCLPTQAKRVLAAFPAARVHWFSKCGHFPMWDSPEETVRLVLTATS